MNLPIADPRTWRRLTVLLLAAVWLFGCGEEDPTGLGRDQRTPPDSLRVLEIRSLDSTLVYHTPVALGRSPVAQVGARLAYTAHVLYAFRIPTRVVSDGDTLRLDTARLFVRTDSLGEAPFAGSMRVGLREVAPQGRAWHPDSIQSVLPPLDTADVIAPDVVLVGSAIANRVAELAFDLTLPNVIGYAAADAAGESLDVNVALVFDQFVGSGAGFLEIPATRTTGASSADIQGFQSGDLEEIFTATPLRRRALVEFDSGAFTPGDKLVASDGHPLHSYLRFDPLRSFLPDSAVVHVAELVLTQVDSADGTSFGEVPSLGLIIPPSRDSILARATNRRSLAFSAVPPAAPGSQVTIPVTAYVFDLQEGNVEELGMILRLASEGTKVRHLEFYGPQTPGRGPLLRIVYGFPADFEGGGR
jgi:hypothetical protein